MTSPTVIELNYSDPPDATISWDESYWIQPLNPRIYPKDDIPAVVTQQKSCLLALPDATINPSFDHWAVIKIDVKNRTISYGDSLIGVRRPHHEAINAAIRWANNIFPSGASNQIGLDEPWASEKAQYMRLLWVKRIMKIHIQAMDRQVAGIESTPQNNAYISKTDRAESHSSTGTNGYPGDSSVSSFRENKPWKSDFDPLCNHSDTHSQFNPPPASYFEVNGILHFSDDDTCEDTPSSESPLPTTLALPMSNLGKHERTSSPESDHKLAPKRPVVLKTYPGESTSGPAGVSRAACLDRANKESIAEGNFKLTPNERAALLRRAHIHDPHARLDPEDTTGRHILHSLCGKYIWLDALKRTSKFSRHVKYCKANAGMRKNGRYTKAASATPKLTSLFEKRSKSNRALDPGPQQPVPAPSSRSPSPPPTVTCLGLREEHDPCLLCVFARGPLGGRKSATVLAQERFHKNFSQLTPEQQKVINNAASASARWMVVHDPEPHVRNVKCYQRCDPTESEIDPPDNAMNREPGAKENLKYVPHVNWNKNAAMAYARYTGLDAIIELADKKRTPLMMFVVRTLSATERRLVTQFLDGASDKTTKLIPHPRSNHLPISIVIHRFGKGVSSPIVPIQDPKHAAKNVRNALFSGTRSMVIGNGVIHYSQILMLAADPRSPLYQRDVYKIDRQDDRSANRVLSSDFLKHILMIAHERASGTPFDIASVPPALVQQIPSPSVILRPDDLIALDCYLFALGDGLDAFQNRSLPIYDRLVMVSRMQFFLQGWKSSLKVLGYSESQHYISRELSAIINNMVNGFYSLVFVYREMLDYPNYPFCPYLHSTEGNEHIFGEARRIKSDFTYSEFASMVSKLEVTSVCAARDGDLDGNLEARAAGYHHTLYSQLGINLDAFSCFPPDHLISRAIKVCYEEVQALFSRCGIPATPEIWLPPSPSNLPVAESDNSYIAPSIEQWFHEEIQELTDDGLPEFEFDMACEVADEPSYLTEEIEALLSEAEMRGCAPMELEDQMATYAAASIALEVEEHNILENIPDRNEKEDWLAARRNLQQEFPRLGIPALVIADEVDYQSLVGTKHGSDSEFELDLDRLITIRAENEAHFVKQSSANLLETAGVTALALIEAGSHAFVLADNQIWFAEVLTMYSKGAGKGGKHGWVNKQANISSLSYVLVQLWEHRTAREFWAVPKRTAGYFARRYARIPSPRILHIIAGSEKPTYVDNYRLCLPRTTFATWSLLQNEIAGIIDVVEKLLRRPRNGDQAFDDDE
ncbi:hypothetical protein RSOLAG22IIIB_09180 [Rhizoctonia solani]|uniref:Uncharacterized protein n=1 Tax=Rhizoctonia solani TaxID=456999 RepID=A0A0K6FXU0_9AGAM|nr:hypothetical protein RSOLAG22IIIB_09180 [Rhizoctonia solani]